MSKFAICSHYATSIGDFTIEGLKTERSQSDLVERLSGKHSQTLELMNIAESIYKFMNLGQLLTALAIFVSALFLIKTDVDVIISAAACAVAVQMFVYCFLGQCVSSSVRFVIS